MKNSERRCSVEAVVQADDSLIVRDFLALRSGLSISRIKDAMNKGAVWLRRRKGKNRRLRRSTATLVPGDRVALYYDHILLARVPPRAECLFDHERYSVWNKPAGLMAQGTLYGDHCSLVRQAQLHFRPAREIFPVHRLDREASGLMLLAHDRTAAAKLSKLFREAKITKWYQASVFGDLTGKGKQEVIDLPLDGKPAMTEYTVIGYDPEQNASTVSIVIRTGRKHQIRRHFDMIGFPVMGDPRYGKGNKNTEGLRLFAFFLSFRCPFTGEERSFSLEERRSFITPSAGEK